MECLYIIEDQLVFDGNKHTLQDINHRTSQTSLIIPASRCFRLLIEKQGEIVSQNELFEEAWRKYGVQVSTNTLYQNISIIRKAMESFGLDSNIISTIPKRGFVINASVKINKELPENIALQPEKDDDDSLTVAAVISPPVSHTALYKRSAYRGMAGKYIFPAIIAFLLMLSALLTVYAFDSTSYEPTFSSATYRKIGTYKLCDLFSNTNDFSYNLYISYIDKMGYTCTSRNWWYLTTSENSPRTSLFMCRHPLFSEKTLSYCKSYYNFGPAK